MHPELTGQPAGVGPQRPRPVIGLQVQPDIDAEGRAREPPAQHVLSEPLPERDKWLPPPGGPPRRPCRRHARPSIPIHAIGRRRRADRHFHEDPALAAMSGVADVALAPQGAAESLDVVRREARLLGERGPARAHDARVGIGLDLEPAEHPELEDADPAELDMSLEAAAPAELVGSAGRTRAAGAR